jgi:uncharacterized protein involved in exopolysaccharide biosynthesis
MLSLPQPEHALGHTQLELVPKIISVFFKWKWLIVLAAVAVVTPVAVIAYLKTPQYQVSMKILVKDARTAMAMYISGGERMVTWPVTLSVLNSEIQILRSQDLLLEAIARSEYPLVGSGQADTPGTRERALLLLLTRMSFVPLPDSHIIEVSLRDPSAEQASRLLNTLASLYLAKHARIRAGGDNTTEFFEQQVAYHRARLDRARAELEAFQERDNIIAIKDEMEINLNRLTSMEHQLKELNGEIQGMDRAIAVLEARLQAEPEQVLEHQDVLVNPAVTQMKAKLVELERQRDELLLRYTPRSRFVTDKEAEIAVLKAAIGGAEQTVVGSTLYRKNRLREVLIQEITTKQAARDAAIARRASIDREKASYAARLDVLKDRTFELGRLRGDFDLARDTYLMYEKKAEEARVSRAMDEEKIVNSAVVQAATTPILPLPRGLVTTAGMSGIAGLVLGVALAFLLEFFNVTIQDEKDVERFLGVPVLATVRQF